MYIYAVEIHTHTHTHKLNLLGFACSRFLSVLPHPIAEQLSVSRCTSQQSNEQRKRMGEMYSKDGASLRAVLARLVAKYGKCVYVRDNLRWWRWWILGVMCCVRTKWCSGRN